MNDEPKNKRKIWPWVVGGVVVVAIAGTSPDKKDQNRSSAPSAAVPSDTKTAEGAKSVPVEVIKEVTAKELEAAYEANEVAAQQAYGDQKLRVKGTIEKIQLDLFNNPQIVFVGGAYNSTMAGFDKSASAQIAKFHAGQSLVVTCEKVSEVLSRPMLSDCIL